MANSGGKITSPVSLVADVAYVLGMSPESDGRYYLDAAFMAAVVNRWSKRKPVNHPTAGDLTDAQLASVNWGLVFTGEQYGHYVGEVGYDRASPYARLLDFDGYVHYAHVPLAPMGGMTVVNGDRPYIRATMNTQIDGGITMTDLTSSGRPLAGKYLCLLFYTNGKYFYWGSSIPLSSMISGYIGDQFDLDDLIRESMVANPSNPNLKEDGTISVRAIACSSPMSDNTRGGYAVPRVLSGLPSSTLGTFYPLPFASVSASSMTIAAVVKRYVYVYLIHMGTGDSEIFVVNVAFTDTNGITDSSQVNQYLMGAPASMNFAVSKITFCNASGQEYTTANVNLSCYVSKGTADVPITCSKYMNPTAFNALRAAYVSYAQYTKFAVNIADSNTVGFMTYVPMQIQSA